MLTKEDLTAIGSIVDEKLDQKLDEKFKKAFRGVSRKKDLRMLEKRIEKKLNVVVGFFDREYLGLARRLERIEDCLSMHAGGV